MGPLATILYRRIFQSKILSNMQIEGGPLDFLKAIIKYYEGCLTKCSASFDKSSELKIDQLMKLIPSLSELKQGMRVRSSKENFIYKIVFEVIHRHSLNNLKVIKSL